MFGLNFWAVLPVAVAPPQVHVGRHGAATVHVTPRDVPVVAAATKTELAGQG